MTFISSPVRKVGNQHAVQVVDLVENDDGLLAFVNAAVRQANRRPASYSSHDARQAQAARMAGRQPIAVRTPSGPRVERRRPP